MNFSEYKTEFEKLLNRDYFSSKVHPLRKQAFSKFLQEGIPNQKWENWKYANLSNLQKKLFQISDIEDAPHTSPDITSYYISDVDTIVIYNGHYLESISSAPDGVRVLTGSEYFDLHNGDIAISNFSPFDYLNTAFMDSGLCLVVDPEMNIETPVRLLFVSNGCKSIMVNPRIHIDMGDSSRMTFLDHHVGDAQSFFQNQSIFIKLGNQSALEHIRVQSNSPGTTNMANVNVKQHSDSQFSFHQFSKGSQLGRTNIYCELLEKGGSCFLNGLSLSDDTNHLDNHVVIDHTAPNCTSSQQFKSVLKGKSSGAYTGRTVVQNGAQKSDAKQSSKSLLLSKNAIMNSVPQLEINADDVSCAHASTTGELDEEAIFYMRSRGLDTFTSTSLMIRGFVSEEIEKIKHTSTFDFLSNWFETWLKS